MTYNAFRTHDPIYDPLPPRGQVDLNCQDFRTSEEAQRALRDHPGDPYGLDRDKDGRACDILS